MIKKFNFDIFVPGTVLPNHFVFGSFAFSLPLAAAVDIKEENGEIGMNMDPANFQVTFFEPVFRVSFRLFSGAGRNVVHFTGYDGNGNLVHQQVFGPLSHFIDATVVAKDIKSFRLDYVGKELMLCWVESEQ